MSSDCIFCKIVAGELPSTKVYEDEHVMAFHDIYPVAPIHLLVIPKRHMASIDEVDPSDSVLLAHLFSAIQRVAREKGIDKTGFRVTTNTGRDGGQVVFHMHFHVMGGQQLGRMG